MSISLFEHNQKAYDLAIAMLTEAGKAAIIHSTGTGKSFIGFKLCEDNPDKTVCWLSPSRYIFQTQLENLKKIGAEVPQNIKFYTYSKLSIMSDEEIAKIEADEIITDEYHNIGNLYSIDVIREEMQNAIEYLYSSGESRYIVNDSFRIIDEACDCREPGM